MQSVVDSDSYRRGRAWCSSAKNLALLNGNQSIYSILIIVLLIHRQAVRSWGQWWSDFSHDSRDLRPDARLLDIRPVSHHSPSQHRGSGGRGASLGGGWIQREGFPRLYRVLVRGQQRVVCVPAVLQARAKSGRSVEYRRQGNGNGVWRPRHLNRRHRRNGTLGILRRIFRM